MESQLERIKYVLSLEGTKKNWRKKHSSVEFQKASQLNRELFGMPLNKVAKCKCIEDMFFMLHRLNVEKLQTINKIKMNQFKLKKGKLITLHGMATAYTEHNMTDEKAISLLKISKGHIKSFEEYPSNWESLVFGVVEKTKEPVLKSGMVAEVKAPVASIEPLPKEEKKIESEAKKPEFKKGFKKK